MGARHRAAARRRGRARRAGPLRRGPARASRVLTFLIREGPATEVTLATRILAYLGLLAEGGRVAILVGSEVVYLAGRGATAATTTPYDVAAVRLRDATLLAGSPPDDLHRYLDALRADRSAGAAALIAPGEVVTGGDVVGLVERCAGMPWADAESRARAAGALVGVYPLES